MQMTAITRPRERKGTKTGGLLLSGNTTVLGILLFVLAAFTFLPSLRNGFVNLDDNVYVEENANVLGGLTWASVRWAFTNLEAGFWHPMTWLSLLLDCRLFGMRAGGYHLTALLLHAANTVLVFLLFRRMTGATWRSAFVAALFAVHPLHVEPVAWVSSRKDVLSTFFGLLALLFYARYAKKVASGESPHPASDSRPSSPIPSVKSVPSVAKSLSPPLSQFPPVKNPCLLRGRRSARIQSVANHSILNYSLALIFFACGLMSKTMVVTLPFIMLLMDWWPLRRFRFSTPPVRRWILDVGRSNFVFSHPCLIRVKSVAKSILASLRLCAFALSSSSRHSSPAPSVPSVAKSLSPPLSQFPPVKNPCLLRGRRSAHREADLRFQSVAKSSFVALLLEKVPFLTASLFAGLLTLHAEQGLDALPTLADIPFLHRIANALLAGSRYLVDGAWPARLAVFYPYPETFPLPAVIGSALLLVSVSALGLAGWCRRPYLAFGWFWYVVTLLPVIGLVQVGAHARADRYAYVPLVGLFALLTWAVADVTWRWRWRKVILSAVAGIVLLCCFALTRRQIGYWASSETLFRHALAVTENNERAHNNLGSALLRQGRVDEAITELRKTLEIAPAYPGIHNILGAALGRRGLLDEAILHLREAVRLSPDDAGARCNLGDALASKGRLDEAISQYQLAVKLKPGDAVVWFNLGDALAATGRFDDAIARYRESLRLNPGYADAHNKLGTVLGLKGFLDEATGEFREALRLKPGYAEARCQLGIALVRRQRFDEAIGQLQEAVRLNPGYAEAHCNLGVALGSKGRLDEAIAELQKAVRLNPGYADAQNNLRVVLARKSAATNPSH